jgi:N-acetyl-anhydromuramyl-L-alanine amidase AmpD
MPPNKKARSSYGVNHVAISIDLIGRNENDLLNHSKQLRVSFNLVRWLMKKYKIPKEKVLGHSEIAKGKTQVPEYTDFADKQYPDRYPPNSNVRGPGKAYLFKLRYFLMES